MAATLPEINLTREKKPIRGRWNRKKKGGEGGEPC